MIDHSSKLLIPEQPLQVLPSLVLALGLNEAIFLQQLHFRLRIATREEEGRLWIKHTLEDWLEELPWLSESTLKRITASLKEQGLLLVRSDLNAMKIDRTNWYSLDYEALDLLPIAERPRPRATDEPSMRSSLAPPGEVSVTSTYKEEEERKKQKEGREQPPKRPDSYKDFVKAFERIWGRQVSSPYEGERIAEWAEKVMLEGWEYALKESVDHGAKKWSYLNAVLTSVAEKGYTKGEKVTAPQALAAEPTPETHPHLFYKPVLTDFERSS